MTQPACFANFITEHLILSKGSKRQEPIPSFLTKTTAKEIQRPRENEHITLSEDLSSAFTSLSKFGQSAELVKPFKHLGEYQNSVLLTQCWARAIKALLKAPC